MNGVIRKLENGTLKGEVVTRNINEKFQLVENPQKKSPTATDKTPDFIIMAESPVHGNAYPAGVAWKYLGKQDHNRNRIIIALAFDDPAFGPQPVYFSGYPKTEFEWEIRLDRGEKKQAA